MLLASGPASVKVIDSMMHELGVGQAAALRPGRRRRRGGRRVHVSEGLTAEGSHRGRERHDLVGLGHPAGADRRLAVRRCRSPCRRPAAWWRGRPTAPSSVSSTGSVVEGSPAGSVVGRSSGGAGEPGGRDPGLPRRRWPRPPHPDQPGCPAHTPPMASTLHHALPRCQPGSAVTVGGTTGPGKIRGCPGGSRVPYDRRQGFRVPRFTSAQSGALEAARPPARPPRRSATVAVPRPAVLDEAGTDSGRGGSHSAPGVTGGRRRAGTYSASPSALWSCSSSNAATKALATGIGHSGGHPPGGDRRRPGVDRPTGLADRGATVLRSATCPG